MFRQLLPITGSIILNLLSRYGPLYPPTSQVPEDEVLKNSSILVTRAREFDLDRARLMMKQVRNLFVYGRIHASKDQIWDQTGTKEHGE